MSAAKRKDANTNGPARPLMPRLAASTQNTRASPAPKLAGYNGTPPVKRPTSAQTTPILPTTRSFAEDKPTPVANFVNANITPRSSSRTSRAGSATPNHASDDSPSRSLPTSTLGLDTTTSQNGYVGSQRLAQAARQDQHHSQPATPSLTQSPASIDDGIAERPTHFFYANRGPAKEPAPSRPQHKKTPSFVYANGASENEAQAHPNNHVIPRDTANKSTALHTRQKSHPQAHDGSSINTAPLAAPSQSERQPSPPRQGFHLTYRKGASQIIPPQPLSPPVPEYDPTRRRTSSIDDDVKKRGSQAFSVSSIGSGDLARGKESGFPFLSMFSLPSSKNSPIPSPTGDGSLRSSGDRDILQALDPEQDRSRSPTSAVGSSSSEQQRAEAAAYARRERKIMDLEISNSSLLVINKSLEREIRRQKMELRSYKRISRKSSLEAFRVSSGRLSLLTEADEEEGSDEQYESAGNESEEPESEAESFADEPMSPGAIAQRDARHRKRDQVRLKNDLAKHKALLADSQRMNQSLKKCMNMAESLIKQGNKALAYKVNKEEIRLGGRVLSADELNGDFPSTSPDDINHLGDPPGVESRPPHPASPGFTIFEDSDSNGGQTVLHNDTQPLNAVDRLFESIMASEALTDNY